MTQCKACPWRVATKPGRDIPNYDPELHHRLVETCDGDHLGDTMRMMACHETTPGAERPCVGWLVNQLGPGNNIALRLRALVTGELSDLRVRGKQYGSLRKTVERGR